MLQYVQMIVHTAVPLDVADILTRCPQEPSGKAKSHLKRAEWRRGRAALVLPHTVDVSLVGVRDQVQSRIRRG